MRKILIINTTFSRGGAAQLARDLFFDLKKNPENQVLFAYGRDYEGDQADTCYFGNKFELYLHVLLVRFFGLEGFGSFYATRKLLRYIEQEKPDLIHLHNLHGYYVNFYKLLNWLNQKKIKVVWTLHDEWLFTWLPAHSMGCAHCKTLIGTCTNKYTYPKNYWALFPALMLLQKRIILGLKNITLVSPAAWLFNEAKIFLGSEHNHLILNGVDTTFFQPVIDKLTLRHKYKLPTDKKIILLSINDLKDMNKGGQYILPLAKKLESGKYFICILGAAKVPKHKNLLSLGYVSNRAKLVEIYGLADLFCFTSAVETAPLSVLEAMSCGLPVVAFDIPALVTVVTNQNGVLVECGNDKQLVSTIIELTGDDQKLKTMADKSREIALARFDQQDSFTSYKKLYDELLS